MEHALVTGGGRFVLAYIIADSDDDEVEIVAVSCRNIADAHLLIIYGHCLRKNGWVYRYRTTPEDWWSKTKNIEDQQFLMHTLLRTFGFPEEGLTTTSCDELLTSPPANLMRLSRVARFKRKILTVPEPTCVVRGVRASDVGGRVIAFPIHTGSVSVTKKS